MKAGNALQEVCVCASASECVLERGWPLWCWCFEIVCVFVFLWRRRPGASGVLLKFLRKAA